LITLCGLLQFLLPVPRSIAAPAHPVIPPRRVLLVHGINDSAKSMVWLQRLLQSHGWQVSAISLHPSNASVPFDVMARQLDTFVAANFPPGEKFDLVAFSMGGLVARYYLQNLDGARHVRRFVTLSTPNHGTLWAWLSGRTGVKQMRPGSPMLRQLNSGLSALAPLHYTSIYTPFDLSILPPASSRISTARNIVVWCPLHPLMVMMPAPLHAVLRALEANIPN
jgi:triacylglycerol lipase